MDTFLISYLDICFKYIYIYFKEVTINKISTNVGSTKGAMLTFKSTTACLLSINIEDRVYFTNAELIRLLLIENEMLSPHTCLLYTESSIIHVLLRRKIPSTLVLCFSGFMFYYFSFACCHCLAIAIYNFQRGIHKNNKNLIIGFFIFRGAKKCILVTKSKML